MGRSPLYRRPSLRGMAGSRHRDRAAAVTVAVAPTRVKTEPGSRRTDTRSRRDAGSRETAVSVTCALRRESFDTKFWTKHTITKMHNPRTPYAHPPSLFCIFSISDFLLAPRVSLAPDLAPPAERRCDPADTCGIVLEPSVADHCHFHVPARAWRPPRVPQANYHPASVVHTHLQIPSCPRSRVVRCSLTLHPVSVAWQLLTLSVRSIFARSVRGGILPT